MTVFDSSFEGLFLPITIDGEMVYDGEDGIIFPNGYQAAPAYIQEFVDTVDTGSQQFQPSAGPGHSDVADRWTFSIPYNSVNGPMKVLLEKIRVRGRVHSYTDFKYRYVAYTATGSRNTYYLPHFRRNAATVLDGLTFRGHVVGTGLLPVRVWVGGVEQTVFYENGPVLTDHGAGTVTLSKVVDSTKHVPFFISTTPVQGAFIELEYVPVYETFMLNVTHNFPAVGQESHSYVFREK